MDSIRAPGHELDLGFDSASEAGTRTISSLADFAFENAMKHTGLPGFLFDGDPAVPAAPDASTPKATS